MTDGKAEDLSSKKLTLQLVHPNGLTTDLTHKTEGAIITAEFLGKDQQRTGKYSLVLWVNKGEQGQNVVDCPNAFQLVPSTELEDDNLYCGIKASVGNITLKAI